MEMERKISEYKTVVGPIHSFEGNTLDSKVNKLLSEGYRLYGNPTVAYVQAGKVYVSQAMVK